MEAVDGYVDDDVVFNQVERFSSEEPYWIPSRGESTE
jgi:hypothetical protein